ncbi:MAG: hypothetical protein WBD10_00110 [Acidobacteriaceae bacterium]
MSLGRRTRFKNHASALWKLALSFRKRNWELSDYPVRVRSQEVNLQIGPSRRVPAFAAEIINWSLSGVGNSPEEALENLKNNFEAVKRQRRVEGKPLLRPGTRLPIEFASTDRIDIHPELSKDFIQCVLGLESAWISDESSLWDFHSDETNDFLFARIREIYGVDVSDIKSAKLSEILDRISNARTPHAPT